MYASAGAGCIVPQRWCAAVTGQAGASQGPSLAGPAAQ